MCDLVGMASADSITAALVLGSDLTNWGFLPDRSVQGVVNSLVRDMILSGLGLGLGLGPGHGYLS